MPQWDFLSRLLHRERHKEWDIWMDFKNVEQFRDIKIPTSQLPWSPDKIRAVAKELDPVNSPRYKADAHRTWCNIFVTDLFNAMGVVPGHWMNEDGSLGEQGHGIEMSANRLVRWMKEHGPAYGWTPTDKDTAFDAAERGHLVMLGWENIGGGSGHVAILLPEGTIAQAGKRNFIGEPVSAGFGNLPVLYFVKDLGRHE